MNRNRTLPPVPPITRAQRTVGSIPHGLPTAITFSGATAAAIVTSIVGAAVVIPVTGFLAPDANDHGPHATLEAAAPWALRGDVAPPILDPADGTRRPVVLVVADGASQGDPGTASVAGFHPSSDTGTSGDEQPGGATPAPTSDRSTPAPAPTPTPGAQDGGDDGTAPTASPSPTETPEPRQTSEPRSTPSPTSTPRPTATPRPTSTPEPADDREDHAAPEPTPSP